MGRGVPRQPDGVWRMPSFLGGTSRGAFGQPAFFLAGNRITTVSFEKEGFFLSLSCLAIRFSLTVVKFRIYRYQISINGKKKFKRTLSCLFGGRRKVQVTKFAFEDFLVGSAANSVGTTLEFAAFRRGSEATYSRASAFWFFLSITMGFAVVRTHFPRKNTSMFMLIIILSREKK